MATVYREDTKRILESWRGKVEPISELRGYSQAEKYNLGKVLENTRLQMQSTGYLNKFENLTRSQVTQTSNVGYSPDQIINMVSLLYLYQVADEIVSVQPIDRPFGVFLYLKYVFGDTRGDALAGNEMINRYGGFTSGSINTRYSSQFIEGEIVSAGTTNDVELYLQHFPVLLDADYAVELVDTSNAANRFRLRKTGDSDLVLHALDEVGYETGPNLITGATNLDLDAGRISFTTTAPITSAGLQVNYHMDLSYGPTDAGTVTLRMTAEQIKAEPHKLRANFTFDADYIMMKAHGIEMEQSLVAACSAEIRKERDDLIIKTLFKQAAGRSVWNSRVPQFISQTDHNISFLNELYAATTEISHRTKRNPGNWAIVGKRGLDVLNSTGRLIKEDVADRVGPYVVGKVDNDLKIIYSPYIDPNEYLVGYKGSDFTDAGFVVADFLPIATTDFIMLDDFVGRQGFVSYYGRKMLNPNMYVRGVITND